MSLPTVSPRCRRIRASVSMIFGVRGRTTHAWQVQSEIADQEGHGGLRRGRVIEVRFRNAYANQTCLC